MLSIKNQQNYENIGIVRIHSNIDFNNMGNVLKLQRSINWKRLSRRRMCFKRYSSPEYNSAV